MAAQVYFLTSQLAQESNFLLLHIHGRQTARVL